MGNLIDEKRYVTIPAQAGWFVLDFTDGKQLKLPIVAWLVQTNFYPLEEWDPKTKRQTECQEISSMAYPVTITRLEYSIDGEQLVVLSPDGSVHQVNSGRCWPGVAHFIQMEVEEAARKPSTPVSTSYQP